MSPFRCARLRSAAGSVVAAGSVSSGDQSSSAPRRGLGRFVVVRVERRREGARVDLLRDGVVRRRIVRGAVVVSARVLFVAFGRLFAVITRTGRRLVAPCRRHIFVALDVGFVVIALGSVVGGGALGGGHCRRIFFSVRVSRGLVGLDLLARRRLRSGVTCTSICPAMGPST